MLCKSSYEIGPQDTYFLRRLGVFSFNERAVRLYERLGFVREGVNREAYYLDYKWHDRILFSVLEKEWKALQNTRKNSSSGAERGNPNH